MKKYCVVSISMFMLVNICCCMSAYASRDALVIGNAAYTDKPLTKSLNDAQDMANLLQEFGFQVQLYTNTDKETMKRAIREFGQRLQQKRGIGLFYYSGHGIQYEGRNYLIPLQTDVASEADIEYETLAADYVLTQMKQANNGLNIVILDACRNNPLARSFTRSFPQGLASMDAPKGSMIAFATSPGQVAFEGNERNGIFTKYLLAAIKKSPQKGITDLFIEVTKHVAQETQEKQVPWQHISFTQQFCFAECDSVDNEPIVPTPTPISPTDCKSIATNTGTLEFYSVEEMTWAKRWETWDWVLKALKYAKQEKSPEVLVYVLNTGWKTHTFYRFKTTKNAILYEAKHDLDETFEIGSCWKKVGELGREEFMVDGVKHVNEKKEIYVLR